MSGGGALLPELQAQNPQKNINFSYLLTQLKKWRKKEYIQKFRKKGFCHVKTFWEIYHWNTSEGAEVERNKKVSNIHEKLGKKSCALYDLVGKGEYIRPKTYVLISEIVKFAVRKGLFSRYLWQGSGSVTFWYGSGYGTTDSYHWNYGPGSCSFLQWLARRQH